MKRHALAVFALIVLVWLLWWFQGLDRIEDVLTRILVRAIAVVCASIIITLIFVARLARAKLKQRKEIGQERSHS